MTADSAIACEALFYTYTDGTRALDGVSFTIAEGEKVAILGPNGAGKSSLMLLLVGILRGEGSLTIHGTPVVPKHLDTVRQTVGLVFQNPDDQLFCPSIWEDVAFGPRNLGLAEEVVRQRVTESLSAVGLQDVAEKAPFHLSFGQRKRAALATVMAMQPRILALDEPLTNLDPRGRREMLAYLEAWQGTRLLVTHDLMLARDLADRWLVLEDGRLVFDGPSADALADDDLLQRHGLR